MHHLVSAFESNTSISNCIQNAVWLYLTAKPHILALEQELKRMAKMILKHKYSEIKSEVLSHSETCFQTRPRLI